MSIPDLEAVETATQSGAHLRRVCMHGADRFESRHRRKDGTLFDVEVSVQYQSGDGGRLICFLRDISQQKEAERTLLYVKAAVESASDAIGISDAQGHHVYQNKALTDLFGYATAEELEAAGGGPSVIRDPTVAAAMFDNITHGKSWSGELEMVTKSGRVFPAFERADAILDDTGKVVGVMGIITDNTERKRAEDALRESEDRFRSFFESSNVGLSVTEPAGPATPNAAFRDMLGYSAEEFSNLTWQAVTHPEDVETTQRAIDALVSGRERGVRFTKRFLHKNGSVVWTDLSSTLHHNAIGQPVYLVSAIVDITERKQAEERLTRQNVMLNALINSPNDILIFSLDRNYCYTTFNEKHRQQMQAIWQADIQIGTSVLECMTDQRLRDLARHSIDRALRGDTFLEIQHQPEPDSYYEFIWNPIRRSEGEIEGVTVFIRDITERRRAEATLEQQAEELRDRNDSLSRFNRIAVGRELRMIELKREVNELCLKLGEPPCHLVTEHQPASSDVAAPLSPVPGLGPRAS